MRTAGESNLLTGTRFDARRRSAPVAPPCPKTKGSELRLMLAVALSALGILTWGWCVSRLPHRYHARITIPLDYLASEGRSLAEMSNEQIWETLLPNQTIVEMTRHCPVLSREVWPEHPQAAFRQRVSLTVQALEPGMGRLAVQAEGTTQQQARDLALAVGLRLAMSAGPGQEARRQTRILTAAEERFQHAEADWNAMQTELRKLEAEREFSRGDGPDDQIALVNTRLRQAQEQQEKIRQYLARPALNLPTAPSLSIQRRATPPTLTRAALEQCRAQRDDLAAVFSDRHPAVVNLDRKIARLEALAGELIVPVSAESSAPATPRAHLEARLARLDETIAELESRRREWSRRHDEGKRDFQNRLAATRQRANVASRERLFAMHQMTQASAALRALEQQGPAAERPPFEEPTLVFDGYHRPRWFLGGSMAWSSLVFFVGFLRVHRKTAWIPTRGRATATKSFRS